MFKNLKNFFNEAQKKDPNKIPIHIPKLITPKIIKLNAIVVCEYTSLKSNHFLWKSLYVSINSLSLFILIINIVCFDVVIYYF